MSFAPIVLFAYNRTEMVRQTLLSLKNNKLASESVLYIFADGPKPGCSSGEIEKIRQVREALREQQWCREVHIAESAINKGLAASVISGVTQVVQQYGKVIVIEDDVILSPFFLQFMNEALHKYEPDDQVQSIGSWNYFCEPSLLRKDYFSFPYPDSIAWATFARSWKLFETNATELMRKLKKKDLLRKFDGGGDLPYFSRMLRLQAQGAINSWAIRWTASAVLHNKTNIFPAVALAKHIGFGSDATHEKNAEDYNSQLVLADKPLLLEGTASDADSVVAFAQWQEFVRKNFTVEQKPSSLLYDSGKRAYRFLRRIGRRFIPARKTESQRLLEAAEKFPRFKPHTFRFRNYRLHVSDFISVAQQVVEYFDEQRLRFNSAEKDPLIIDCGSNVGVSLLYFRSLFPQSKIVGFEADHKIFSLLQENMRLNGAGDIELHNEAVWIHNDFIEFGSEGADGGSVHLAGEKIKVKARRLKDYLEQFESVDLLKMDIEGAEVDVLTDCAGVLERVRLLFVEYHSFAHRPQDLDKLLGLLTSCGFRYFIHSIGSQSLHPFVEINAYNGMDVQLEIHAVKTINRP